MGGEPLWTRERATRPRVPHEISGGDKVVVHDRSSAHYAGWHSVKRPKKDAGKRFKLHDTRVWMRLMFWAARETGAFENPAFESWYIRFIAHFVRFACFCT